MNDQAHSGEFTGRTALVTGGGSGIGRAVARRWAAGGGHVTVPGRREEPPRATVELIEAVGEAIGGGPGPVVRDVRDPGAVDAAAFLIGDRAAYITGEVLTVDGGQGLGTSAYTDERART
ncbi:SDR family NAD(P)-dependent oxidoreductase [Streptomyces microflavus]|uniref:SDR family NAD(P)-dependent oxidoreductase n=1 Tax=Streptomyces microflavus TaxID=1919 RepID=UPI0037F1D2E2